MNFEFKKKYGQNFISDKNLIDKITDLVPITKSDLVIEIGPGEGALTYNLANKGGNLLIYEIDSDLKSVLESKLKGFNNYSLFIRDFLDVDVKNDLNSFSYNNLILVSNLPYYITTPIIKKIIDDNIMCDYMVLMVQEEVADRFCAEVGSKEYGSLTVYLNAFYDIKKCLKVNRKMFNPSPNVDSAVVVMKKKKDVNILDYEKFKKFVKDCFRYKRKNIKNNLKEYDLNKIESILSKYNLKLSDRAEKISVDIFIEIANSL